MEARGEWVELAFGYDRAEVKLLAEAQLIRLGLNSRELSDEDLRLDIGTDTELRDFYRVSVRGSLIGISD
jgi:hypothetical protein